MTDRHPQIFASHHLGLLRGAAWVAILALLAGVAEWMVDAWVMEYALDISSMWLFAGGAALFAGTQSFLNSSVRVVIEEKGIRVSQGPELLTGRSKLILWDRIHTATLLSPPRHRSWFHRLLYRSQGDVLNLQYRSPERKMLAVPVHLHLGGLDEITPLIDAVERHAGPAWKVAVADWFGTGERIEFDEIRIITDQIESGERRKMLPESSSGESGTDVSPST